MSNLPLTQGRIIAVRFSITAIRKADFNLACLFPSTQLRFDIMIPYFWMISQPLNRLQISRYLADIQTSRIGYASNNLR